MSDPSAALLEAVSSIRRRLSVGTRPRSRARPPPSVTTERSPSVSRSPSSATFPPVSSSSQPALSSSRTAPSPTSLSPSPGAAPSQPPTASLASVLVYTVGTKFRGLNKKEVYAPSHMCSLSERTATKVLKQSWADLVKHNRGHLTRLYPGVKRLGSSNLEPVRYWAAGCQLVAINWQSCGASSSGRPALWTASLCWSSLIYLLQISATPSTRPCLLGTAGRATSSSLRRSGSSPRTTWSACDTRSRLGWVPFALEIFASRLKREAETSPSLNRSSRPSSSPRQGLLPSSRTTSPIPSSRSRCISPSCLPSRPLPPQSRPPPSPSLPRPLARTPPPPSPRPLLHPPPPPPLHPRRPRSGP